MTKVAELVERSKDEKFGGPSITVEYSSWDAEFIIKIWDRKSGLRSGVGIGLTQSELTAFAKKIIKCVESVDAD